MKAVMIRSEDDGVQTLGTLILFDGIKKVFECNTLELSYKENKRNISCIPLGKYDVVKNNSPKFGETFLVKSVPGRSHILIHKGNYNKNTHGCILVGSGFSDINKDGIIDIYSSGKAMSELLKKAKEGFYLQII